MSCRPAAHYHQQSAPRYLKGELDIAQGKKHRLCICACAAAQISHLACMWPGFCLAQQCTHAVKLAVAASIMLLLLLLQLCLPLVLGSGIQLATARCPCYL